MEQSDVEQYAALIRHWLHEQPSPDAEDFALQAARSLWLEERHFSTLNRALGGK